MSTHSPSEAVNGAPVDHGTTESELARNLIFGMVIGTPVMYGIVVSMCLVAGLGIGNALAIALLPACFGGVFFAGIVPLLRQSARNEHAQVAARLARASTAVPTPDAVDGEARPAAA